MFDGLARALFPSRCFGCGAPGLALCTGCRPSSAAVRRARIGGLDVVAAAPYGGTWRRTILAYKRGRRDAGDALSGVLARCAADVVRGGRDVLVPVPTAPARRRERGFDQGVRLARDVGRAAGVPVLAALRQSAGDAQRGRSRAQRLRAWGRFVCEAPGLVRGVEVVLVDDVVTTGATLRDCAATLERCGAVVRVALVLGCAGDPEPACIGSHVRRVDTLADRGDTLWQKPFGTA